ncbi:MAG: EscU/YscU/HrcU family type III secretion system export apparatus switch protein [Rickettsiales bacterium]|nr:EscU/YscU/HrcU family type III secretion system export apparatus switch protein [Rickettsiales bacterium]
MNNDDKKQKAIALGYEMGVDEAPKVLAKGEGEIAKQIIKIAEEKGIEIKKDASLVEILSALEIDDFIPLEAYSAVAEILKYIYNKQGKL